MLSGKSHAQFVLSETFSNTTFDQTGWVVNSQTGTGYIPTLTATADNGTGWLRMTNNTGGQATYARLTTPIPSLNNNISVSLKYQMWTPNSTGADGFTISLRDASVPFDVGAFGGSLGYAQKNQTTDPNTDQTHAGMAGGYFSVGIDAYGNFSSPTEGRVGGTTRTEDSVAVRGPGSGDGTTYTFTDANGNTVTAPNYSYVGGTGNLTNTLGSLNFTNANTRPVDSNAANDREVVFNFTTENILTVSLRFGATGTLTQVISTDLTTLGIRPENLELVFTAGTGGIMQYTEIKGLTITTTGAPVGTIYYSNYSGDNKWGTGQNWGNATSPNIGVIPSNTANLIFSNHKFNAPQHQLTTAQNVDLGANRSAGSIQFDAPFNYTLQGYTLTLASGQTNVPTAITVTSVAPGGAHTIQSNVALGSDLNVNLNTGTALNLSGNIAAGTHDISFNTKGTTTIAGQLTGSGTLTHVAGSTGTTVITGNSSATFTGNVAIEAGTIRLGNSNVLNSATNVSLSTANSYGTLDLANNNQGLGNITFVSGGLIKTGTGTLSLNGNVTTQSSATSATITGNVNLGASTRTLNVADGGVTPDLVISANIAGTGGLNKTGSGSLQLSGANTFSGANTLTAGTTIAASNTALGSGTSTVSSGATLALQGDVTLTSGTVTVSGSGYTGSNGAIDNRSGNNTLASNVTLAGSTTVGAASGSTLTLAGAIGQSTASNLTIAGAGTTVLAGSNSYSGTTTVNNGTTLVAASNNAMGTTAGGTTVASGGTLAFQGGINYTTAESVSVSGNGAAGRNGAIDNLSGNNTFAGAVALTGATRIGAESGTNLTLAGTISGANSLTIGGAGSITASGANTYSGTTTVTNGATLIAANNSALGNTGANTTTTVSSGGTLGLQNNVTIANENITINGTGSSGSGALTSIAGSNAITNQVTMGSSSTVGAAAGSVLTLSGGITDGASTYNLTKADAGTVQITGAASYGGTTTITGGTLAFAGAGTLASTGNIVVTNGALTLDNSGTNNTNRIANTAPIALNDGRINFIGNGGANSTEALGTVTAASGANNIYLQAQSGRQADLTIGNLVQNGSSTLTFSTDASAVLGGGGTSAGSAGSPRVFLTQINGTNTSGSLANPTALAGWILVTDSTGNANFAEYTGNAGTGNGVRALSSYYTGSLGININDPTESVLLTSASPTSAWTLTRSNVTTDANLKITDAAYVNLNTSTNRTLRLNSGGLLKSGATTTDIYGSGGLTGGANGTLVVTVDNAAGVLNISAPIVNNGTTSLTKSGAGLLTLTGTNTFSGNVNINEGVLRVGSELALGPTNTTKSIIFNGGTINITNSFTPNTRKTWTIGANASGTFDIDANRTFTLANAGDLTSSTTSTLIKSGQGTFTIAANNTGFTGGAIVNAGTLELRTANALGTNRTIELAGGNLRLESNSSTTFASNINVTANSSIAVDRVSSGTNLTHTLGSASIGNSALTVSGANGFDLRLGTVTLTGGTATLNPNTVGSDLTVGAIVGTGDLVKQGSANLTLAAASSYSGSTTVSSGTLFTQGTNYLPTTTALTIASGATVNTGGNSQTLAALASGNVTDNATFNLGSGDLTVGDATTTVFGGTITADDFTKRGSGSLTLGGTSGNTFSSVAVNDGTLIAAKSSGNATGTGTVAIGDGTGGAGSAVLQLNAANQISDGSAVTIASDGRLNLNGNNETIASVAGAGSVALGSGTLTIAGSASTTYSGQISGTGGLVKSGTGTLALSGSSSYSGATAINQGTVQISASSALGTGAGGVSVANGAGLELSSNIAVNGAALSIIGSGASGNGSLRNLSGDNTWSGTVALGGASNVTVSSGNLYLTGGINTNGNQLTVTGSGNLRAGAITGSGSVVKNDIGALILNASGNTYTGTTTVNAGSLQINANNAGPASSAVTLAASGATLNVNNYSTAIGLLAGADGSTVTLGSGSLSAGGNNGSTTFSGTITGAGGSFTKTGTGSLILNGSGANTLSGTFAVNAGTVSLAKAPGIDATGTGSLVIGDGVGSSGSAVVQLNAANQINNASAVTVNSDGRLNLNGTSETIGSLAGASSAATVVLGAGTLTTGGNNGSTTFAGSISGTGGLIKVGSGTMTLTGTNTFTGGTVINGGTLALAATNTLTPSGSLTINNGGTLDLSSGISQTVAGLTTSSGATIDLGSGATLTVNTASTSTLLGSVTGSGTLAYAGGGNVTLGNGLNFGGTLSIGGTTVGGTPSTRITLGGNISVGTLHITGDTILDFGNSTATTLNATNLIINAGVKVSVVNWVNLTDLWVAQNFQGALPDQRGGTPTNQITFSGNSSNSTAWQSYDHQITPAPEPATYGMLLIGASLGFVGYRRWRTRAKSGQGDTLPASR